MRPLKMPDEIEKLYEIFEPYFHQIYQGNLENVPEEAIEAHKKVREWAFEQGQ